MNSRFQVIILFCAVLSIGARAQSLSVSFPDTVRWGAAIDSSAISFWANNIVTNTTANTVTVDVVRVQDATGTPGWFSEFCFQYCSQSWVDSIRTTMQPNEIVNIAVHINVSSTPDTGSVLMKYVNVNDSTDVHYQRFYASTSPVGIQNNNEANTLHVSPNPANNSTILKLNTRLNNGTISISDFCGNTVMQLNGVNGNTIEITCENLGCGLYLVSAYDSQCAPVTEILVITN